MKVTKENISKLIAEVCPFKIVKYTDFLCVKIYGSYKEYNTCTKILEENFGSKVISDAAMNSIYVDF